MLRTTAAAVPTHDAIVHLDRRISHEELYRSVRAGADGLRLHGLGPGDTVLLALTNCPEFVVAYFATALLHAKVHAIDPNAPTCARRSRSSAGNGARTCSRPTCSPPPRPPRPRRRPPHPMRVTGR